MVTIDLRAGGLTVDRVSGLTSTSLKRALLGRAFATEDLSRERLPKRLALQDSYIVLYIAGDALVDGLNWGKMMNAITARNRSVFAHGFRFIEPVQYAAFKRVVEDRLQAYCAAEGLDMDRTMDTYRFVTLFSDEGNAQ